MIGRWFNTPLRAAALGVLAIAAIVLVRSAFRKTPRWREEVLVLVALALGMVMLSRAIH